MAQSFDCPSCGAPLEYEAQRGGETIRCPFCNESVIVPAELRKPRLQPSPLPKPSSPPPPQPQVAYPVSWDGQLLKPAMQTDKTTLWLWGVIIAIIVISTVILPVVIIVIVLAGVFLPSLTSLFNINLH